MEISSPSTRRLELVRKRDLYQRFGVPEYWYVDLELDRVELYVLEEQRLPGAGHQVCRRDAGARRAAGSVGSGYRRPGGLTA